MPKMAATKLRKPVVAAIGNVAAAPVDDDAGELPEAAVL